MRTAMAEPMDLSSPWTGVIAIASAFGLKEAFSAWWKAKARREAEEDKDRRHEAGSLREYLAGNLELERKEHAIERANGETRESKLRAELQTQASDFRNVFVALSEKHAKCEADVARLQEKEIHAREKAATLSEEVKTLREKLDQLLMRLLPPLSVPYPSASGSSESREETQ